MCRDLSFPVPGHYSTLPVIQRSTSDFHMQNAQQSGSYSQKHDLKYSSSKAYRWRAKSTPYSSRQEACYTTGVCRRWCKALQLFSVVICSYGIQKVKYPWPGKQLPSEVNGGGQPQKRSSALDLLCNYEPLFQPPTPVPFRKGREQPEEFSATSVWPRQSSHCKAAHHGCTWH